MARQKLILPFGGGVDRKTGLTVVDPDAMADVRNAHLSRGQMELRRGIARRVLIEWGDDVLGIFSIRADGLAAVVVFEVASREVRLYVVDGALNVDLIDTLWTLPAAASVRVSAAESYSIIAFAHDEPEFGLRQATRIFDAEQQTIVDLTSDLDRSTVAETVRFQQVYSYLNYLMGTGYGTGADEDRPEVLRISKPGEPTVFVPEHYFLVGLQGEPIVGCGRSGDIFEVSKPSKSYKLIGYDHQTFGVRPLDENYGQLSSRLGVTVVNERFRWALDGPRVSQGGVSADVEPPLDLDGPAPDDAAPYPRPFPYDDDLDDAFAFYDSVRGEVWFVFGWWAYILHLKDGPAARRWSYRTFDTYLLCAGLVYEGGAARVKLHMRWTETTGPDTDHYLYGDLAVSDPTPQAINSITAFAVLEGGASAITPVELTGAGKGTGTPTSNLNTTGTLAVRIAKPPLFGSGSVTFSASAANRTAPTPITVNVPAVAGVPVAFAGASIAVEDYGANTMRVTTGLSGDYGYFTVSVNGGPESGHGDPLINVGTQFGWDIDAAGILTGEITSITVRAYTAGGALMGSDTSVGSWTVAYNNF